MFEELAHVLKDFLSFLSIRIKLSHTFAVRLGIFWSEKKNSSSCNIFSSELGLIRLKLFEEASFAFVFINGNAKLLLKLNHTTHGTRFSLSSHLGQAPKRQTVKGSNSIT